MKTLPFYADTVLVRVSHPGRPGGTPVFFYLDRNGFLGRLDGRSSTIHRANDLDPINLDDDNILAYLRFFCGFVHSDEGPFNLLSGMGDLFDFQGMDEKARAAIAGTIRPPTLLGRDDDGAFLCEAFVLYGAAVFEARFAVAPNGMVQMLTDDPVRGLHERH